MADRTKSGIRIARAGRVEKLDEGLYSVLGDSGERYAVRTGEEGGSCACRDFEIRGGTCKHIYAVEVFEAKRRREEEVARSRAFFGDCMANKRRRSDAATTARWGEALVVRGRA